MAVDKQADFPSVVSVRCTVIAIVTCLLGDTPAAGQAVVWSDIEPLVTDRCTMCHQGEFAPLGLRLDSLDGLLAGSDNGPVVVAGEPDSSELILRIRGESQPRMPMTGPPFMSDGEIARFEAWVTQGLQVGDDAPAVAESGSALETTAVSPARGAPLNEPDGPVTWQQVAPIFATRCAKCHTGQGLMGPAPEGYRLTSYEEALASRDRARIVPGNPEASELYRRILGQSRPRMPFDGPPYLSADELDRIRAWIAAGAPDTMGRNAVVPVGAEVRLHGVLSGRWVLDDLPLKVDRSTRIDKNPRPGDYVQVRGRVGANGSVYAERIRPR